MWKVYNRCDQCDLHFVHRHRVRDDLCVPGALVDRTRIFDHRSAPRNHQLGTESPDQEDTEDDRRRNHRARGSTTESLRNIELVKSLGLAHQEVVRLNGITGKILKLELKKVKYLRSLSFIQGTAVNALRTSIMFLMLYLIFRQEITIGQFFSLLFYSFYIFTPLQELGNVINTYRETEVSLQNFQQILDTPRDPKPVDPEPVDELLTLQFDGVSFQHQSSSALALDEISFQRRSGRHGRVRRPVGSGQIDAGEVAGRPVRAEDRVDSVQRDSVDTRRSRCAARENRLCHAGYATLLRIDPREPALREPERDAMPSA